VQGLTAAFPVGAPRESSQFVKGLRQTPHSIGCQNACQFRMHLQQLLCVDGVRRITFALSKGTEGWGSATPNDFVVQISSSIVHDFILSSRSCSMAQLSYGSG
jgi:hypothetical protein